jgi:hypothetical protein
MGFKKELVVCVVLALLTLLVVLLVSGDRD